jgi:Ca-activated chloride channel family protein
MRFLRPDLAWWLLGLLALVALRRRRARRRFVLTTSAGWFRTPAYRPSALRRIPSLVVGAGALTTAAALLQPVTPFAETEITSRGLDIVIVLDLSSSMQEPIDFDPRKPIAESRTRLEATKDAIRTFVRGRADDRIGLVVFSDHAYVVSPLTFDTEYLERYIDMVDDRLLQGEGQTAIGEGLALANYLLAEQARGATRGHQVLLLYTDGENNRGRDPLTSLEESHGADIRVHMVGVALEAAVTRKPEVRRLVGAIRRAGGRYFNAMTSRELTAVARALDALEKGSLVGRVSHRDVPVYEWFAVPALLLVGAGMTLRALPWWIDRT